MTRVAPRTALYALVALLSCDRAAPAQPKPAQPTPAQPTPASVEKPKTMEHIQRNYSRAELVFTATLLSLEASPGVWSGTLAVYQKAHYRIVRVYKGSPGAVDSEVVVQHLLVQGSPTADETQARLSPALFQPGKRLLLFAKRSGTGLNCLNSSDGVVRATDEVLDSLN